jgi:hypothetical protein
MNIKFIFLITIILTISYNQNQNSSANEPSKKTNNRIDKKNENKSNVQETLNRLQGKWQHIDDKSNYIVFEGNLRKEKAGDMTEWDEEKFILSNSCLNESDKHKDISKKEFKYLSCIKSDLCWYILKVDKNTLVLSYMGRGNTLTYKRVK